MGKGAAGSRVVEPRPRELATNGRISRAASFFPLTPPPPTAPLSLPFPGFCDGRMHMRDREKPRLRTHFSRCSPGFVALSPWMALLAGLLALKSDTTGSLFRPALGAALDAGAAGSAGFALKFKLTGCGLNWD